MTTSRSLECPNCMVSLSTVSQQRRCTHKYQADAQSNETAPAVTFARHVARTGALAELTREELVGYLVPAIRALLAPAIAATEGGR